MGFRLVVFVTLAIFACRAAAQDELSMNPCHGGKWHEDSDCERVKIPSGMCKSCPLLMPREDGNFKDCKRIFDLDAPGCHESFKEYVKDNPCDERRKELVEKWDDASKQRLDYFAYAMCEQCCDNVPYGATKAEYAERNNATLLWDLKRGNGPAHFFYDICSIFPKFKYFVLPWDDADHSDYPTICDNLQGWLDSPASNNWPNNNNVAISEPVKRVIADSMWALECHDYSTWTKCVDLEAAQQRI